MFRDSEHCRQSRPVKRNIIARGDHQSVDAGLHILGLQPLPDRFACNGVLRVICQFRQQAVQKHSNCVPHTLRTGTGRSRELAGRRNGNRYRKQGEGIAVSQESAHRGRRDRRLLPAVVVAPKTRFALVSGAGVCEPGAVRMAPHFASCRVRSCVRGLWRRRVSLALENRWRDPHAVRSRRRRDQSARHGNHRWGGWSRA